MKVKLQEIYDLISDWTSGCDYRAEPYLRDACKKIRELQDSRDPLLEAAEDVCGLFAGHQNIPLSVKALQRAVDVEKTP